MIGHNYYNLVTISLTPKQLSDSGLGIISVPESYNQNTDIVTGLWRLAIHCIVDLSSLH